MPLSSLFSSSSTTYPQHNKHSSTPKSPFPHIHTTPYTYISSLTPMLPAEEDDDANSSSSETTDSIDQNPNPTTSIDQSLDAIEGQLTSISLNHHHSTPLIPPPHPQNIDTVPSDSRSQLEEEEVVAENIDTLASDSHSEFEQVAENPQNIAALPSDSHSQLEQVAVAENSENIGTLPSDSHSRVGQVAENTGQVDELRSNMYTKVEKEAVGNSRGQGVLWRNNSDVEVEVEGQGSPSSSGYAGGKGTSSSSSSSGISGSGIEEISGEDEVVNRSGSFGASVDSEWVPGKRHVNEDDASVSWRKRKKHFFILSHSGKPIYSRYGDEHRLAGFSATLQAIISFVENGGDRVKLVRAGKHQVVFLVKGPIYLVCISCTEEPHESLSEQLELLYGQMILILTKSINRCFEKNPKFDMTPLLGGLDAVFSSLIHSFSWNPATFLHAYSCLPLAYPTRQAAGAILQDVAESGVLFAILMCKHKVISLVGAQKASLHPDDMLLLANFVMSSESFRTSESFSPICLPRYNSMAFLYTYVYYLDADTYLMLLTANPDAFHRLKDWRIRIEMVLLKSNVLNEAQRSMLDGGMRVEDLPVNPSPRSGSLSSHLGQPRPPPDSADGCKALLGGPAGLWHFIYRSIYLDQYVSSEFSSPINTPKQQKRLYRAYQKLYTSMHDRELGPHKTQFRRDENYVLLCWVTQDFELYAAFDPLADKALAIKTCNRVCQWVKDVENEVFLLGASPFSW